jgi:cytochrome c-type biogenesis protein CcmH
MGKFVSILSIPLLALLVSLPVAMVMAIDVDSPLEDPEQIALYEKLGDEVRCLVCQNQTIGDSSAPLAQDLRREIREQIAAGRSEAEIKDFLTERYGDFILYRPRFGGSGMFLWLAPVLLLLVGGFILARIVRRRSTLPVDDPTAGDETLPG